MPLITEQDSASRLARAIVTDVRLYNETRLLSGEDLTAEIAEARQLYRDHVEPSLYDGFETALAEVLPELQEGANSIGSVTTDIAQDASPPAVLPDGLFRDEPQPTKQPSRGIPVPVLWVLIMVAIAVTWLVTR
ncbi:MAG: hypothetical protein JW940_27290 [Polyangiaceae bacterium]|nr:hypothetical protein [Polyangiaceae bacterium]